MFDSASFSSDSFDTRSLLFAEVGQAVVTPLHRVITAYDIDGDQDMQVIAKDIDASSLDQAIAAILIGNETESTDINNNTESIKSIRMITSIKTTKSIQ